jgi:two-component system phosphate regulon response regulator PhoB
MPDAAIVRPNLTAVPGAGPRPPASAEYVVTVRIVVQAEEPTAAAHQIAERLRTALAPGRVTPRELVPLPRATGQAVHQSVLEIDVPMRIVRLRGVALELTRREFDLLLYLARHPGRVYQRGTLLEDVWHASDTTRSRTVDVHIRRLRSKLGQDDRLIGTVRRVGYRLDSAADLTIVE